MHPVQYASYGKIVKKMALEKAIFDSFGNSVEKFHKNPVLFLLKKWAIRILTPVLSSRIDSARMLAEWRMQYAE